MLLQRILCFRRQQSWKWTDDFCICRLVSSENLTKGTDNWNLSASILLIQLTVPLSLQGDVTDVHEAPKHPRDECVCVLPAARSAASSQCACAVCSTPPPSSSRSPPDGTTHTPDSAAARAHTHSSCRTRSAGGRSAAREQRKTGWGRGRRALQHFSHMGNIMFTVCQQTVADVSQLAGTGSETL